MQRDFSDFFMSGGVIIILCLHVLITETYSRVKLAEPMPRR